jgi:hypothetical protein
LFSVYYRRSQTEALTERSKQAMNNDFAKKSKSPEGKMKAARILAPFGLSAVLFILAYLSSKDTNSGYFPVMLFGIGIILIIIGAAAIFPDKKDGEH